MKMVRCMEEEEERLRAAAGLTTLGYGVPRDLWTCVVYLCTVWVQSAGPCEGGVAPGATLLKSASSRQPASATCAFPGRRSWAGARGQG